MRVTAAKGRFIIQLLHERQPQIRPCFQEMRTGRRARLVDVLGQMHRVAVQVNRVKVVDLFTAMHIACDDVGRVNGVHRPRHGPRIVRRAIPRPNRMGLTVPRHDTLNRRITGKWLNPQTFQMPMDGMRTDQSIFRVGRLGCFKGSTCRHNGLLTDSAVWCGDVCGARD